MSAPSLGTIAILQYQWWLMFWGWTLPAPRRKTHLHLVKSEDGFCGKESGLRK